MKKEKLWKIKRRTFIIHISSELPQNPVVRLPFNDVFEDSPSPDIVIGVESVYLLRFKYEKAHVISQI